MSSTFFVITLLGLVIISSGLEVPAGRSKLQNRIQPKRITSPQRSEEFVQKIVSKYGVHRVNEMVESHKRDSKNVQTRGLTELEGLLLERFEDLGISNQIVSALRFQRKTIWKDANATVLSGLVEIDEGSGIQYMNDYVWVNELIAIVAINPILSEISRNILNTKRITFHSNENILFSNCTTGSWNSTLGNCGSASNCDGCVRMVDGLPEVRVRLETVKADMVELLLRALVSLLSPIHTPLSISSANLNSAYPVYDACFSVLAVDIYGSSPPFTLSNTIANLRSSCDNVVFQNQGFIFCYEGTPYSKQGGVSSANRCGLANNTCTSCINDGSCTMQDKCGYYACEYSQNGAKFCDTIYCLTLFQESQCCSLDLATNEFFFCPPSDNPKFTSCSSATKCANPKTTEETDAGSGKGGGCFIATAAFGSEVEPQVWALRAFRDEHLLTNPFGSAFVNLYYRFSPPIANFISGSEYLKVITRVLLAPLVALAQMIV